PSDIGAFSAVSRMLTTKLETFSVWDWAATFATQLIPRMAANTKLWILCTLQSSKIKISEFMQASLMH
ncbi:MAG: hypothetical protein ABSE92_12520, partial [Terriglobales bacterium]